MTRTMPDRRSLFDKRDIARRESRGFITHLLFFATS